MRSSLRIFLGALLVVAAATLTESAVGQQRRPIRRITASDLPATSNATDDAAAQQANLTDGETATRSPSNPTSLNITEVFGAGTARSRPRLLNVTERLAASAGPGRRQRPATATESNATLESTTRRPYVPVVRGRGKSLNLTSAKPEIESSASANIERPVVSNNTIPDEKVVKKNTTAAVAAAAAVIPDVRPTDRTFNNIVSSSTAKIVMQENIHTDILRHLTTASYAHYETDYVLDESDAYETESSPRRITANPYEKLHEKNEYAANFSTPGSVLFDETFARVSEGIQQKLDEIVEKSEELERASESAAEFGGGVEHEDALSEVAPTNDTKVSLHLLNHVNAVSNDSATANSRRGELVIDNATHVDFERSFLQTKVLPDTTVRYLIDDVYSTTKIIPTSDEDRDNNISKETLDKVDDQSLESAEEVTEKVLRQRVAIEGNNESSAQISKIREKEIEKEPLTSSSTDVRQSTPSPLGEGGQTSTSTKQAIASTTPPTPTTTTTTTTTTPVEPEAEATATTARGRSRMFSSERYPAYNTNNTVDESVTESRPVTSKPTRSRMESTVTARSRSYSMRTAPSIAAFTLHGRRFTTTTEEASTIRSNLIRDRISRPSLRRVNSTASNSRPVAYAGDSAENNEGNDIVATENKVTARGAVKFDANDQFPIPPTASAWSLATMKEPGRRHRVNVSQTTTAPSDGDSEASGSYSKLTTIYNVLAPTELTNATAANKFSLKNKYVAKSPTTEAYSDGDDQSFTSTQSPNEELTTTEVPQQSTRMPTDLEESVTTQRADDVTTITNDDHGDEDELRFDGVNTTESPTTESPRRELTTIDSDQADVSGSNSATTTESYETTRMPKDDADKMPDDVLEDEVEATTAEPAAAEADGDDGSPSEGHADTQEHKESDAGSKQQDETAAVHFETHQENQPELQETRDKQNEEGNQENHSDNNGEHRATKTHEEGAQKEDGHPRHQPQDEIINNGEEETDYGGQGGAETETPVNGDAVKTGPKLVISNKDLEGNAINATSLPAVPTTSTSSPTSTSTPTPSTPSPSSGSTEGGVSAVPTYMRAFVGATMQEFCDWKDIFRKAVADLLTEGTGRSVSSDDVVLRNIETIKCEGEDIFNASSVMLDPEATIPIELYIVDRNGEYDKQLNDAFPLLWGHSGLDFPLKISKVDVVDESLAHSGGSMSSGPVIAAITISCIGAVCLLIAAALLIVMRKRQKKVNYGMRCTPVSLDAYSLDSVSVHGSVRRKGGVRASKRSYGNPAFDDPSSPTNALNFANIVTFTTDRAAMDAEFGDIPHVTPKSDELPEGAETKNRYSNVIPLPETRVVLAVQGDDPGSDYINANFVRGPKNAPKCYIACQAPLQSTVTDFWRMVWEQQTKVIMMLTDLVENGVEKSGDYLPPSEVLDCHRLFGDYQVTLKKREVRETYVISTLQLKNMESNTWREIVHLWYLDWPGQGVPEEASSIIAFLIEARSYMKNSAGPSVVHCSPGTGRTGTVLACDLCIREFEQTRTVDVPKCVYRLRKDRAGCVQTRDQYAFIYKVLNLYATKLTGGALDSI